ncbi:MAG TPA: ATP-dependent DNA helicase RecG [Candidatus Nanopelagicaceae bacterium]|jgi:ATP-dependent DNA helicase RecG|nr:ATP-dependent DNA helicase RecG [Candidatus Nanopelagicaceae bacterium]
MASLESRLISVLGDKTAKVLAEHFEITTVGDLLRHYPRRYVVRGELTDIEALNEGEEVTIFAKVESTKVRRIPGRKGVIVETIVTDGRAKLILTFFNQAWREKDLREGRQGLFAGKVGLFKGKRQLAHPDYLLIPEGDNLDAAIGDFAGRYLPVYPATSKLPSWKIAQCVRLALNALEEMKDYVPHDVLEEMKFPDFMTALREVHEPTSAESAERARARLTFDEALLMQLFLVLRRLEVRAATTKKRAPITDGLLAAFDQRMPFELTAGQKEVWREISADLASPHPMYRLLQGDVGSGKTIIALRAMLSVVDSGGQAALLAPTEVLAQQHYRNFHALLGDLAEGGMLGGNVRGTQVALLTGSLSAAEKKEVHGAISSGAVGLVVGTHALLSEGVSFNDLGLIVVDEQHRFGVEQRDALREKAAQPPHVLVMTATPIPRTVAMTIFGDLDVSVLRELPLGRSPITTHVVSALSKPQHLDRAWQRATEEVKSGHQVYIVAPRISPSDDSDLQRFGLTPEELKLARALSDDDDVQEKVPMASVEDLFPQLSKGALSGVRVGKLHGRMHAEEKESVMQAFSKGDIDVLISTTVIEVGVDVPNASMMIIMDADRFGVSQLHQLRGRVGRGTTPGLCLLVTNASDESPAMERLSAVAATTDGFELSRLDLEQRREGDVLGSAQSGVRSHLRLLRVIRDEDLISQAREVAERLVARDPLLDSMPQLKIEVDKLRQEERAAYLEKR